MSATTRFHKIKYDGDTVELHWPTSHNADRMKHTLTSPSRPKDELPGSLQAFVPHVLTLMSFEDDYRNGLRVRGLTIKDAHEDEARAIVLTCQKTLDESEAPFVFSTPLIKDADTGAIGKLLDQAEVAATNFLRGERYLLDLLTEAEAAQREQSQTGIARFDVTTGPPPTDEQIRASLNGVGLTIDLADIRKWHEIERADAIAWIGAVVASNFGAGAPPEEPFCIADATMSIDRLNELLEAGPYLVVTTDAGFEVMHRDTKEVAAERADKQDAEIVAARFNKIAMLSADISEVEVVTWAAAGPWVVTSDGDGRYSIVSGTEEEGADSELDAMQTAARYNRTIGERGKKDDDSRDLWETAPPPKITDDAVQEVKAVVEGGDELAQRRAKGRAIQ